MRSPINIYIGAEAAHGDARRPPYLDLCIFDLCVLSLAGAEHGDEDDSHCGHPDLRIAQDGVPAEVVVVEPTGSETQVMLKLGGADIVAVFRDRISARPGETIKILPDLATVHLFDGESGQRLAA